MGSLLCGGAPFAASHYLALKRTLCFAVNVPACGYGSLNVNGRRKTAAKIEKVKSSNPYAAHILAVCFCGVLRVYPKSLKMRVTFSN